MKLTIPQFEYKDLEFGNEHDIFSRKAFGDQLENLIMNNSDNTVFALDAPWGSGKTTFIRMWVKHLKSKNIEVLHFDAFMNDYQKDPFAAIASEIYGLIPKDELEIQKEFEQRMASASLALIRGNVNMITKLSTGGAIGVDDLESMFIDQNNQIIDEAIKRKIKLIENDRDALSEFKSYLSKFCSTHADTEGTRKKVIFIVDELDRCRPDFALEFLERIKHIFAVDGITFLLVTNRAQINETIRAKYGQNINPTNYLHKFINIWLSLPVAKTTNNKDGVKYFNYVLNLVDDKKDIPPNQKIVTMFTEIVTYFNPSFREIERMISVLAILYNIDKTTCRKNQYAYLIPLYCYIHVCHPEAIKFIKNKNYDALCNAINFELNGGKVENITRMHNLLKYDLGSESIKASLENDPTFRKLHQYTLDDDIMTRIIYILSSIDYDD